MKVAIIEDEFYTAEDLKRTLLQIDSSIEVVAILQSLKESKGFFEKQPQLDLIFSDIKLGDGDSFELFSTFAINAPVVFITAYNNFALQAFKANGIDYVLKPFGIDDIKDTLARVNKLVKKDKLTDDKIAAVLQDIYKMNTQQEQKVLVFHKDKILPIPLSEIALFYIEEQILRLIDGNGNNYIINHKLDDLEKIAGVSFFRANRQHLVNKKFIKEINTYTNRKQKVLLTVKYDGELLINKEKTTTFLNWIKGYLI
jgi:two-component system, LytTR family, response regulator LytT